MIVIQLAGIRVRMNNRYPFIERQCREYLATGEEADFSVEAREEEIREEQESGNFSAGYCESICLYRHICEAMPAYGVFIMHSAVVEVDGKAYAFTAKSGVGKSTHLSLWLKNIPRARVLNGDKPLYRIEKDGSVTAYGTPWNGKENWGYKGSAKLQAICFIERGTTNSIRRATEDETIARLMHQLYLRGDRRSVDLQLGLMNEMIKAVPYYVLSCTISDEAAQLSYQTMKDDRT